MTLNGVTALILSYFTEFGTGSFRGTLHKSVRVYNVVVKSSRLLSHLLASFLSLSLWKIWLESIQQFR